MQQKLRSDVNKDAVLTDAKACWLAIKLIVGIMRDVNMRAIRLETHSCVVLYFVWRAIAS